MRWLDGGAASTANLERNGGTRAGGNGAAATRARLQRNAAHPIGAAGVESDPPDPSTQEPGNPPPRWGPLAHPRDRFRVSRAGVVGKCGGKSPGELNGPHFFSKIFVVFAEGGWKKRSVIRWPPTRSRRMTRRRCTTFAVSSARGASVWRIAEQFDDVAETGPALHSGGSSKADAGMLCVVAVPSGTGCRVILNVLYSMPSDFSRSSKSTGRSNSVVLATRQK